MTNIHICGRSDMTKIFVPYNYTTKKFAVEKNSGGSSWIEWSDNPFDCVPINEYRVNWFKENFPNSPVSAFKPPLQLAVSRSAEEDIAKCGVIEVEIDWKFA